MTKKGFLRVVLGTLCDVVFSRKDIAILGAPNYITRWHLTPHSGKLGHIWRSCLPGVFVHHIQRSGVSGEMHSNTWSWAFSLILKGWYIEHSRHGQAMRHAGDVVFLDRGTFHRIELLWPEAPVWTLFVVGPERPENEGV